MSVRGALWRVAPFDRREDCRPEWFDCAWHALCVDCGELVHLAAPEASAGFGPIADERAFVESVIGRPARCAECRAARR